MNNDLLVVQDFVHQPYHLWHFYRPALIEAVFLQPGELPVIGDETASGSSCLLRPR